MKRVNQLITHQVYRQYLASNDAAEETREFCHHDFNHGLTVARISYILWLEAEECPAEKEMVYAAALLHDIGRFRQYQDSALDHAFIGAELALPLLQACGFDKEECTMITEAIAGHREPNGSILAGILKQADQLSRPCMDCPAAEACYWKKKNKEILY